MKKFTLIAIALLVGLSAMAQSHIKFKGIEVTGTIKEFVTKYKAKCPNAKEIATGDPNTRILKDTFCDIDGEVLLYSTKSGVVYEVIFCSDGTDNWEQLVREYDKIFELLKIKYGTPIANNREFKYPYNQKEFDGLKASAVKAGKCEYGSLWQLAEGTIALRIVYNNSMLVGVCYLDKFGSAVNETEKHAQYQDEV